MDRNCWIILTESGDGVMVPALWECREEGIETPTLYDTEREAEKDLAAVIVNDMRFKGEDDEDTNDLVERCVEKPDGVIVGEDGEVIWSPHVDQSTYGR